MADKNWETLLYKLQTSNVQRVWEIRSNFQPIDNGWFARGKYTVVES
jgi:hypothetical protein